MTVRAPASTNKRDGVVYGRTQVARSTAYLGHPQMTKKQQKIGVIHATFRQPDVWYQLRVFEDGHRSWLIAVSIAPLPQGGHMLSGMKPCKPDAIPPEMRDQLTADMMSARLHNKL